MTLECCSSATGSTHQIHREILDHRIGQQLLRHVLHGGFDLGLFQQRTGRPLADIEPALKKARAKGLIEIEGATVKPTLLGQRFLNELLQLFLE